MRDNDTHLLEEAYVKMFEAEKLLIPRRSKEERAKNHQIALQRQIQQYIKNGSKGDLDLARTPIQSLPDNLKVGGDLDLRYSQIKSLPDNLTVGGSLDLAGTPIQSLPANLTVAGDLYLWNTPLSNKYSEEELRAMLPNVVGKIYR